MIKSEKTLIESCSPGQLFEISVTIEDVIESIVQLKNGKKDSTTLSSDHLKSACCVVSDPLSDFFTSVLIHGYMPSALRDCMRVITTEQLLFSLSNFIISKYS